MHMASISLVVSLCCHCRWDVRTYTCSYTIYTIECEHFSFGFISILFFLVFFYADGSLCPLTLFLEWQLAKRIICGGVIQRKSLYLNDDNFISFGLHILHGMCRLHLLQDFIFVLIYLCDKQGDAHNYVFHRYDMQWVCDVQLRVRDAVTHTNYFWFNFCISVSPRRCIFEMLKTPRKK